MHHSERQTSWQLHVLKGGRVGVLINIVSCAGVGVLSDDLLLCVFMCPSARLSDLARSVRCADRCVQDVSMMLWLGGEVAFPSVTMYVRVRVYIPVCIVAISGSHGGSMMWPLRTPTRSHGRGGVLSACCVGMHLEICYRADC